MRELVNQAIQQCADREPLTRTMALLHGARVLAVFDKNEARRVFAEGVKAAEALPLDPHRLELVLDQAVQLGATADPVGAIALFRRLPSSDHTPWLNSTGTMLVQSLAKSGEFEAALGVC